MEANMKTTIENSFTGYAAAVLQSRALVDVRDCIKPSARQIFYCLETDKFIHSKPFQKTLKALGSAFRMYIHGDSSAEGILMRASQPFAMRYPLIEVEGSNGNLIESGNWAAPRYTGCRLSAISQNFFSDLSKDTIDEWKDNYDDSEKYPAVLPSKGFYNLANGTSGIGVGAASSVPQFNIKELNKALVHLLYHPDCSFEDIYCAPDFATGAILLNEEEVKESLKNGQGKACLLRSKITYDLKDNCLIVTEIPYGVYTNTICGQLEAILDSDENPGIERFNDLTGLTPNIKIYLNKNANEEEVLRYLYKNTSLQYFYGINFTMLGNRGRYPRVFTWKETLQAHLDHEKEVYRRGYEFDLKKIKDRLHIINGILIVIANLEEVINIIKNSTSTTAASIELQKRFLLDEKQTKAVLNIKLFQLAKLEVKKYEDEKDKLEKEQKRIEEILNTESLFFKEIEKGFNDVAKKFGDDRRTQITNLCKTENEEVFEQRVESENCVVAMTQSGLIKRIPSSAFKVQRRNGKGVKTLNDIDLCTIKTNTVDSLLLFSNKGNMYRILVNDIPTGTNTSKGVAISSLIKLQNNENITLIYSIYKNSDANYILFVTKNGLVKKTLLSEYTKTKRKDGIAAINLREDDELVSVNLIKDENIILITKQGMCIKFNSNEINTTGRATMGVKGINLNKDDNVVSALIIRNDTDMLAIISEKGLGKKFKLSELLLQKKGGKGLICYKPTATSGNVIGGVLVENSDNILISGEKNSICISASEIPIMNRAAVGNQLIKQTKVHAITKV